MNLKLISLTLGAALALGGTLSAQQNTSRWNASASVGLGTDSLHTITNTGTSWWDIGAYNLDLGYSGMIAGSGVPFRASIGLNHLPSGKVDLGPASTLVNSGAYPIKNSLLGYYIAGDMFVNARVVDNLYFVIGISVNQWSLHQKNGFDEVTNENTGINTLVPAPGKSETYSIPGLKFGGRFGIEYKVSDNLAFDVLFQIIEAGQNRSHFVQDTTTGQTFITGSQPWNPSWLQFGVKFSF